MNAKRFQEQTTDQMRIDELLFEIKRLERKIQVYEKGFIFGFKFGFYKKKVFNK